MRRLGYAILLFGSAWKVQNLRFLSVAWSSYTTDDLGAFPAISDHVASARAYFATREAARPLWLAVQLRRGKTLTSFKQGARRAWGLVLAT